MNSQIDRICAEHDLRKIATLQTTVNGDAGKKTVEHLTETKGEIYRYGGGWIVEAEAGAGEKLLSLMG